MPLFTAEFCRLLVEESEHCTAPLWDRVAQRYTATGLKSAAAARGTTELYEPQTTLSFDCIRHGTAPTPLPTLGPPSGRSLDAVWNAVVARYLKPLLEALWQTFRVDQWATPVVRKYEPARIAGMQLHYDTETISLLGYLNADFDGRQLPRRRNARLLARSFDRLIDIMLRLALASVAPGGGTSFPRWSTVVGRSADGALDMPLGSVVVFPGGVAHLHEGLPITRGERYIIGCEFF